MVAANPNDVSPVSIGENSMQPSSNSEKEKPSIIIGMGVELKVTTLEEEEEKLGSTGDQEEYKPEGSQPPSSISIADSVIEQLDVP